MIHSPIPWNISRHGTPEHSPQFGLYSGGGHNSDIVIVTGPNAKADAEFIKRAVENHDALVEMLDELIDRFGHNGAPKDMECLDRALEVAREARHG